jgi:hypothetical protein
MSWIFIHLYVVQGWKWISLLTCVEMVGVQHIRKNDFHFMIIAMVTYGGVLGVKPISMVCDGNNVFQGAKVGVTT